jgi:hypothetical protein
VVVADADVSGAIYFRWAHCLRAKLRDRSVYLYALLDPMEPSIQLRLENDSLGCAGMGRRLQAVA